MTKYQLVFVKMETAFSKIFNRNKLRDLKKMQSAFNNFKLNTISKRISINSGSRVALENLKRISKVGLKNGHNNPLKSAFFKWKNNVIIEKSIKKKKEELDYELEEKKADVKRLERRIVEVEEEIDESEKRYSHFYSQVKENKRKISVWENKNRELSHDINEILDRGVQNADEFISTSQSSQDRIAGLNRRLYEAINENKELKEQLNQTNDNVKNFITEMSSLISSHEILKLATDDGTQEFEEESGGGSVLDDQREDYVRDTPEYRHHVHTTVTQGGRGQVKAKRRR